jgi:hypothetical protein
MNVSEAPALSGWFVPAALVLHVWHSQATALGIS